MRPETRMFFVETPSNPLMEIADMQALADLAHSADCMLVVDNCACTPVLQQPLEFGTDIVIHSATKYLDGQGRCVGGAVVTKHEKVATDLLSVMRSAGPSMSPFNAWVFLKGLETLTLRVKTHSSRASVLARWLEEHPSVRRVYYPGLTSHPQHVLASKQQTGFGGLIAFEIEGAREEAWTVVDSTRFISITANFGDAKSTITHPASTTHGRLTPEERARAGIGEGLLRVSVGLEDLDDLKSDLRRGLDAIAPPTVARATGV
jgi:O-succinylhomoserine sulfhydrylase